MTFNVKFVTIFGMINSDNLDWLTRRLKELGKTKGELAAVIEKPQSRLSELIKNEWDVPVSKVGKMADFLKFDKLAFLDFLSGEISEQELWQIKPEIITDADRQLLQAFKAMATASTSDSLNKNIPEQTKER